MEKHKINKDKLLQILLNLQALNLGGLNLPVKLDTEVKVGDLIDVEVEVGGDKKKKHHHCFDPCKKPEPCCDPCKKHDDWDNHWDGHGHHDHKKCDCKGRLRQDAGFFKIYANVCPHCKDKKSEVIASLSAGGFFNFLFKSKDLTPPLCDKTVTTGGFAITGRTLNTGGVGTITTPSGTFDAGFSLSMSETFGVGNPDAYTFTVSWIGSNGAANGITVSIGGVPDQKLSIKKCHHNHCDCGHHHGFSGFDNDGFDDFDGFDGFAPTVNAVEPVGAPRFIAYTIDGVSGTIDLNTLNA